MSALGTKLRRDLWSARGQVVTIALVLAVAIAGMIALIGSYRALYGSQRLYYERTDFPEVFARLGRAPKLVAAELARTPGVAAVETRTAEPAVIALPTMNQAISARVISLPGGPHPLLEGLVLRRGRAPEAGRSDECVVLDAFMLAHRLSLGDSIAVTLGGRQHALRVVGTVLSPEYVFAIGEVGMMPDDRRFTAIFMSEPAVAAAIGSAGSFNEVLIQLEAGASEPDVLMAIDRVLAPYGGRGAYGRDRHPQHRYIASELEQLRTMAIQVPVIFLLVAVFLVNVVLTRLVAVQREQIAALRALGYTAGALARHYLTFAAAVALLGSAVGLLLGELLGGVFIATYAQFFRFPVLAFRLEPDLAAAGIGAAIAAALIGAARAVRGAVRLPPAEAMRPPAPARYRRGWLSRLGLLRLTSPVGWMVVRELERRPLRALISVTGLAFAMAVVVLALFSRDTMDHLMEVQFRRAFASDLAIGLIEPAPAGALGNLRALPGVLEVEPSRTVPVRIRVDQRWRDLVISGLSTDGTLRKVLDRNGKAIPVPRDGLLVSAVLADRLGFAVGDEVTVERLDGDRRPRRIRIAGLIDDMMGVNAYLELEALARWLDEEPTWSGAALRIERDELEELHQRLRELPGVIAVLETRTMVDAFEETTAGMTAVMTLIILGFAITIAIGVVYNNARVAFSERSHELATLRVLGFTSLEVGTAVIGEMTVHVLLAVPLGLWLGKVIPNALMAAVDAEQYRMIPMIAPRTHALGVLVVAAAAVLAAVAITRRIRKLDPVSALKAKD